MHIYLDTERTSVHRARSCCATEDDWVKRPSGVQARTLEIEDELIEEFFESDIEV